jgi:hypothetical protein
MKVRTEAVSISFCCLETRFDKRGEGLIPGVGNHYKT